jgi:hypothetical protein
MTGEPFQVVTESGVGRPLQQLVTQQAAGHPAGPPSVGDNVGDGLTVHRQDHPLTGPNGVDDLARAIAQLPHTDLHVRQRSTEIGRSEAAGAMGLWPRSGGSASAGARRIVTLAFQLD